jgi:hypothetical protein
MGWHGAKIYPCRHHALRCSFSVPSRFTVCENGRSQGGSEATHRFRGSAPQIKSGAGSAREALSPVRSPAGRLPQKHWLAPTCNTVAPQECFKAFVGARLAREAVAVAHRVAQRQRTAFVGALPRSSLGQALREKRFRQFFRRQAGSHRSTGSHRRATQLLHRGASRLLWERALRAKLSRSLTGCSEATHRFRGCAQARCHIKPCNCFWLPLWIERFTL